MLLCFISFSPLSTAQGSEKGVQFDSHKDVRADIKRRMEECQFSDDSKQKANTNCILSCRASLAIVQRFTPKAVKKKAWEKCASSHSTALKLMHPGNDTEHGSKQATPAPDTGSLSVSEAASDHKNSTAATPIYPTGIYVRKNAIELRGATKDYKFSFVFRATDGVAGRAEFSLLKENFESTRQFEESLRTTCRWRKPVALLTIDDQRLEYTGGNVSQTSRPWKAKCGLGLKNRASVRVLFSPSSKVSLSLYPFDGNPPVRERSIPWDKQSLDKFRDLLNNKHQTQEQQLVSDESSTPQSEPENNVDTDPIYESCNRFPLNQHYDCACLSNKAPVYRSASPEAVQIKVDHLRGLLGKREYQLRNALESGDQAVADRLVENQIRPIKAQIQKLRSEGFIRDDDSTFRALLDDHQCKSRISTLQARRDSCLKSYAAKSQSNPDTFCTCVGNQYADLWLDSNIQLSSTLLTSLGSRAVAACNR